MKLSNQGSSIYDLVIRLLFLLFIVAWCGFIVYPFLNIILWSLILALAMFPLHKILSKKLGQKPKLASVLILLVSGIIFILPTIFLTLGLIDEIKVLKTSFNEGTLTIPAPNEKVKDWPLIGGRLYNVWQEASVNLAQTVTAHEDQLMLAGKNIVRGVLGATTDMLQIVIAFIIAGVLLAIGGVGESIRKFFRKVAGNRGDEFADVAFFTVGSVVKGIIGVALILALIHGIIFLLAGVPFAGIWTLLVFVLSVLQIPVVLVTLPIIFYIFAEQDVTMAVIWTVLLVIGGLSDNILKPILLGKGAPVPMLVIFIGVIGGFIYSGFIGLFTGAIILSIGYKLFIAWVNSPAIITLEKESTSTPISS